MKVSIFIAGVVAAGLLFLWGCSTTNHAILPTQAYHDITSHYNAYFNANEKYKSTIKTVEANHKDKFDSVIAVYGHNDVAETAPYASDLDDVIKRSTQSIQLHNVANWSDDNMLLIGKANYLKGDYDKASASFKYITTEYKDGVDYVKVQRGLGKKVGKYVKAKKKKKKPEFETKIDSLGNKVIVKKDNRPEKSIWWHTPSRSEALVWLIKTYTRQKKYDEAASVVTYVHSDDYFYKDYDPQLELASADVEVSRKNYQAAIEPLEKYLAFKKIRKKKRLKVRPLFVLAQCYEATSNAKNAIENYRKVLKSRPNYDMEFYAKIKLAKLGRSGSTGNADIKKLLARMSKDGKYKDYWDQIFYELALIAIQENQRDLARTYLHKSVDNSTTNDDQKAHSYLQLAELDYEEELYVNAKFYYDSTLAFLAKTDYRYNAIDERDKMLGSLVEQLNIIAYEDSMQKLAAMSEPERKKIINITVAKKEAEDEAKKTEAENAKQQQQLQQFMMNAPQQQNQTQSGTASNWYFYNTAARATGYNDFVRKWGKRKLEENWRRKNKSSGISQDENEASNTTIATDTAKVGANTQETEKIPGTLEEQLEANIPLTQEKLAKSNDRLADAYYNAGTIYKDGLEAYAKAQNMFETLNKKLTPHKLLLESYYQLYLLGQLTKNKVLAEEYKAKILAEFPESVIAKILRDPNFINATKQKEQEVNNYYELAYNDYSSNQLDSAWYKCKVSDAVFKPNPLSAKFELLLALVLAKQNKLEDYVQLLQKLSNKSTDAEVKKVAGELLALLNKSELPQIDFSKDTTKRDSLNAIYQPQPGKEELNKQLNEIKEQAKKSGADVKVDTTAKSPATKPETEKPTGTSETAKADSAKTVAPPIVTEDTTSIYTRSDAAVHYFILFTNNPEVTAANLATAVAKINAYNANVYEKSRLQTKQVKVDSKTTIINVRQFSNGAEAMSYFKSIKDQAQLFDDFKPGQYSIACISTTNFSTLLTERNMEEYLKFFKRVYK